MTNSPFLQLKEDRLCITPFLRKMRLFMILEVMDSLKFVFECFIKKMSRSLDIMAEKQKCSDFFHEIISPKSWAETTSVSICWIINFVSKKFIEFHKSNLRNLLIQLSLGLLKNWTIFIIDFSREEKSHEFSHPINLVNNFMEKFSQSLQPYSVYCTNISTLGFFTSIFLWNILFSVIFIPSNISNIFKKRCTLHIIV